MFLNNWKKLYALKKGLVIKSTGSWYLVKTEENDLYKCKIKGKFRTKGIRTTNPLAVGDWVEFKVTNPDSADLETEQGLITGIKKRNNYIIRKSTNLSKHSQIIAANVDQAFLIVTINYPQTLTSFIDRFLVSAEAYNIPVNLVFNKMDLYSDKDLQLLEEYLQIYVPIGYKCFQVSAEKNFNIDKLRDAMAGKVNVLSGHSGVGKSTIINTLQPGLDIQTGEISEAHLQGKHTTTFSEMHRMDNDGYIIDTPGIRGFGVIDLEKEDISHYFPEIFEISDECQFNNCTHTHEPGCAVKEAVEEGDIAHQRYENYLSLLDDDQSKYRS